MTLKDGTKADIRSVPKFREIAKYCLSMAEKPAVLKETGPKGFWEIRLCFVWFYSVKLIKILWSIL